MNPIAMALLVGGLNLLFAYSAFRRLSLLAAGAPARPLDRVWERLTLAPGDRGSSLGGSLLVSVALVSLMAAPAALLGGLAGGDVGRSFLLLGGTLGGLGGGLALFWALRAQIKMPKYRLAGLAHYGIFLGFAVLTLRTVVLVGRGFDEGFNLFVLDPFHRDPAIRLAGFGYNILKDIVVVTVLFGVVTFIRFRMQKVKRLAYGWHAWVVLGVIATMMLSDVLYDGGHMLTQALRAGGDTGAAIATYGSTSGETLGRIVATVLHALGVTSPETAHAIGAVGFWTHVFLVFAFLNYLPYGKHFHVVTSLPNVLLRPLDPPGRLEKMADTADALVEKMAAAMEAPDPGSVAIGVARLDHFSWKSILDFYTCTECGRCSDNCPAHTTGKLLSPKHLTIDLRDYAYEKQDAVFHANSYTDEGEAPKPIFGDNLVPDIIHPDVIWACTTCRACEEQCPVMISYVDKIVDMRRNLVMVRGEFPAELQKTFQALETNGNPWNITRMDRGAWSDGLDVPLMSDKPDAEVLYWVGCAGSYDDRAKKIARATVRLFREAGVNFAILGSEETCTGDPARRAGNEHLFMMLAEQNVATLNNYKPKKIVTTCPHCFNTLLNEYPDFGARYEVVHHTDFLLGLLAEGRLKPTQGVKARVVFHDSCYLGRYNDVYDAPRKVLQSIPGVELVEAEQSREKGLCCGAGGAQMWMEEQHSAERVNNRRTLQLLKPEPSMIASGCPFCQTMITDGIKGMEDTLKRPVEQLDVAEVLERSVVFTHDAKAAPKADEATAEATA
jgi:Fe-S oxidoreductase